LGRINISNNIDSLCTRG